MAPRMATTVPCDIVIQCDSEADSSDDEELFEEEREISVDDLLASNEIHLAVLRFGWGVIVNRLQEGAAQLTFRYDRNDTVLHRAFLYRAPCVYINIMLSSYLKETCENLVNSEGLSYFHIASATSSLIHVREFLSRANIDINCQVHKNPGSAYAGYTALHFAVEYGRTDVATYLLESKASIYVQDEKGTTPLLLACHRSNPAMIDLLLTHDRDYVNIIDNFNTSHFMAACMSTHPHFAQQYLIVAYHRYNISPITLVFEKCLMYLYRDYTPLHFAAKMGRLETVKMLLAYGADCCALTSTNKTPLMLATTWPHLEVCNILKQHCETVEAQISNEPALVVQSQTTLGYSKLDSSRLIDVEASNDKSNQLDCSMSDTKYGCMSACMSPTPPSTSNRQYSSDDEKPVTSISLYTC